MQTPAAGADPFRIPIALSGLLLVLFLATHLLGLALAPLAPASFEAYASALHHAALLPAVELGLLLTTVLHLVLSLRRRWLSRQAGNTAALRSRRQGALAPLAVLATRSQAAGGLVLMLFLVVHLRQLRLPRPADGHALEVLQTVLSQPLSLALYLTAALAGAMHLFHGGEAAHRSLGWLDPANAARIRAVGRLLALLVGAGFMAVTLALALPVLTAGTP